MSFRSDAMNRLTRGNGKIKFTRHVNILYSMPKSFFIPTPRKPNETISWRAYDERDNYDISFYTT